MKKRNSKKSQNEVVADFAGRSKSKGSIPNLDFTFHNTVFATHRLHSYAAKCPPQLARYGIRYYSKPGEIILDPMSGSGTTLVEARLIGRNAIGYDIDPLAKLIATVKSRPIHEKDILRLSKVVIEKAKKSVLLWEKNGHPPRNIQLPTFRNRDYWFLSAVSRALAVLSHHIGSTAILTKLPRVADFLWVAFSSLILAKTSVANARDITHSRHHYKKHSEIPDVIQLFESRVKAMLKQMSHFRNLCKKAPPASVKVRLGDARNLRLRKNSIDLIFTSPPYASALDYYRAHFLAVSWMREPLSISPDEFRNNASRYIGTERGPQEKGSYSVDPRLLKYSTCVTALSRVAAASHRQAKLTQKYFLDMQTVLKKCYRVLKNGRHAIIVVCPSHIRKTEVPTHEVLTEIAEDAGFRLKRRYTRTIDARRRLLPYMIEEFGKRMSTEYVLIFQKI